jgi:hypothetical protein
MTAKFLDSQGEHSKATPLVRVQTFHHPRPAPVYRAVARFPEIYATLSRIIKGILLPKSLLGSQSIGIEGEMEGPGQTALLVRDCRCRAQVSLTNSKNTPSMIIHACSCV